MISVILVVKKHNAMPWCVRDGRNNGKGQDLTLMSDMVIFFTRLLDEKGVRRH